MPLELPSETVKNSPKFQTEAFKSLFGRLENQDEARSEIKRDKLKQLSVEYNIDSKIRRSLASDIYPIPEVVNPARRESCVDSCKLFAKTYFPYKFNLSFSDEHEDLIQSMDQSLLDSEGLLAYAFPRGSGKTTLAEILCIKALFYGQRRFVVLISAEG
jgi:hypothetical protein